MTTCCTNPPYYMTAYGIAVQHGFKGTEEEWLESLKAYIHVKYSENLPQNNADMQDEPANWMGILADHNKEASEEYSDYTWIYLKGEANAALLADPYSSDQLYPIGSIVSHGEMIVKSVVEITEPEPFDSAKWVRMTLAELIRTSAGVEDASITPEKLAAAAVTTAKLMNASVTRDKIADGEVTHEKLGLESVDTDNVKNKAITHEKLGLESVDTDNFKNGAVTRDKIANAAVGPDQIDRGAVTGDKLTLTGLPDIMLTAGVHYFAKGAALPTPTEGKLIFQEV